ncbi:MAG: DUF4920 domain-containing protein [Planctomycetes bacterium]|nr:DUF4920 domain-containing protein [Planctomycetota bacterium]
MGRTLILAVALLAACASTPKDSYGFGVHGTPRVEATALISNPALYDGKPVLFTGTIDTVCQRAGCWVRFGSGDDALLVTFKDRAFTLPLDCGGRRAKVEGVFTLRPDGKRTFVATGVQLL